MSESVFPQNLSGSWATGSWPSGEVVVLYCKRQGAVRWAKKKPPDAECRLLLLAARHWAANLGPSVPTRSGRAPSMARLDAPGFKLGGQTAGAGNATEPARAFEMPAWRPRGPAFPRACE